MTTEHGWGRDFDPDELARLETRMWKAYYHASPRVSSARSSRRFVRRPACRGRVRCGEPAPDARRGRLARVDRRLQRFAPDIGRAYRLLGLPRRSTSRRSPAASSAGGPSDAEMGLAAGEAAGDVITDLYAALYEVPRERVAEAGRLRGMAAEVRDRGAADDPEGSTGAWSGVLAAGREAAPRFVSEPRLALDTGTTEYE